MDEPADNVIGRELGRDERLMWTGRPPFGLCLRRSDWFHIPAILIFTGLYVFWAATAVASEIGFAGGLFGSISVAFGVSMLVGRFWYTPWTRRRTWYGVTSERVIVVIRGVSGRRVHSILIRQVAEVRLTEWRDGGGLIGFGAPPPNWATTTGGQWATHNHPGLMFMELGREARQVFDLIRNVQRGAQDTETNAAADGGGR